jgi:hypothetical protein
LILGIAAVPLESQLGKVLFKPAEAQDSFVVPQTTPTTTAKSDGVYSEGVYTYGRTNHPASSRKYLWDIGALFGINSNQPMLQVGPTEFCDENHESRCKYRIVLPGIQTIKSSGTLSCDSLFFGSFDGTLLKLTSPSTILSNGAIGVSAIEPVITGATTSDRDHLGFDRRQIIVLTANTENVAREPNQQNLSSQFVELSNQLAKLKLKRTHSQRLALEVETLKKEISDQEAGLKLEEAQEQLKKIMNEHPESPAAQSAKRMLETGTYPPVIAPGLVPVNALPTY